ncbi:hypothetical protein GCM10010499_47600 [Streptomyces thermoviolaceus subsp. apingens]|nr:hypothetical protein GCM10010499_47600 [Streptomyces thermoviolaceus subsp. apingens]
MTVPAALLGAGGRGRGAAVPGVRCSGAAPDHCDTIAVTLLMLGMRPTPHKP